MYMRFLKSMSTVDTSVMIMYGKIRQHKSIISAGLSDKNKNELETSNNSR